MKIFYFSGTGNSYSVAKDISLRVKVELIPIPKVMGMDYIHIDTESIGIVFPSYLAALCGVPLIVERFVRKITDIGSVRIFAVCTCGGYECVNALPSLKRLRRIIRSCGGKLSAEYSVRLPMNNLDYDHIPIPINRDTKTIIDRSKSRIDDICKRIINKKGTRFKTAKILFSVLMTPLFVLMRRSVTDTLREKAKEPADSALKYPELIPLTDRSIVVDEKACIGCGLCAKVCPVNNIRIVDQKPEFQHRCEMCFACDEWCPSNSIHHWSRAEGVKYRHPDAELSDMVNMHKM